MATKLYSITDKRGETENNSVISGPPDSFLSTNLDSTGEDGFRLGWYNRCYAHPVNICILRRIDRD